MDLNQEPPLPPELPCIPQPKNPPNKPLELFTFPPNDFSDDLHNFPFGEFLEDFLKKQGPFIEEAACQLKQEIDDGLHGPLQFRTDGGLESW